MRPRRFPTPPRTARSPGSSLESSAECRNFAAAEYTPRANRLESPRMPRVDVPLARLRFAQTSRRDNWWVTPLVVFTVFTSFIVYATWAALHGAHCTYRPY